MAFEQFEHTADVGIKATGENLEEVFAETARGMFSIMTDIEQVSPIGEYKIELSADDLESLLVEFLSELIYLFEVKSVLFSQFEVDLKLNDAVDLIVTAKGEEINSEKHELYGAVKAVSYHDLLVDPQGEIRVIFDV